MKDVVKRLLSEKSKGEKWVEKVLPILVTICSRIREIEAEKKEKCEPLKLMIEEISSEFGLELEELKEADQALRQFILEEHEGTEPVCQKGVGTLAFPQRWGFDIVDFSKVDRKYLVVDTKAVNEAIKNGLTVIKGLTIEKKKGIEVRIERDKS